MKVKSIEKIVPSKARSVVSDSANAKKANLIFANDEFVKSNAKDDKVSMGALVGVCALGISILYGTFKLTDTLFKRF